MRRLLTAIAAMALLVPTSATAAPTVDASDIERVYHDTYGDPNAPGTTPFFASGTDLAFDGDYVYAAEQAGSGNTTGGVHIYDVSDPDNPVKLGFVNCPGYQNDVAVVEPGIIAMGYHSETGRGCRDVPDASGSSTRSTTGVRLFDVSDPDNPVALGVSPALPGGTHTLTVDPTGNFIYASPGGIANGGGVQQIIDVTNREGPFKVHTFKPNEAGCHDFTFFTATDDTPMGVCVGLTESQIWDLTDITAPKITSHIVNPLIQFHHTAMVTDDGKTLVIGDEAIGANECVGGPTGAMYSYDISNPALPIPQGYFGIDRSHNGAPLNSSTAGQPGSGRDTWCTAHIYNFIPGTSIMVAVWYSGGLNIIDWSDPTAPREIAHYRTDGADYKSGEITNYWSGYWHDGRIYANDRVRGFDALKWTAYEEYVGAGGETDPESVTAFARSLPSTPKSTWRSGRFFNTPTAEQALHLAARPKVGLRDGLASWACRLTLLD
ncbi:MAG TPA: hypothetical protein VM287_05440 [Egibacteraceae bacterium]|nr:hypothetical protein [Egibacteraceae bacterium]HVM21430.1 hypothetical protein [Egibacteraceae bacterium]